MIGGRLPPLWVHILQVPFLQVACGGLRSEEFSGGKWITRGPAKGNFVCAVPLGGIYQILPKTDFPTLNCSTLRSHHLLVVKVVIWLILPVVICLSQRLSHACLSISKYTVKLRMAHYISYRLFDSTLLHG